ncbi:MAG: hypothetical protein IJM40_04015 [Synergistaceae bacterium]|nr:hypothetical protein [Synergistaceae bacterium]
MLGRNFSQGLDVKAARTRRIAETASVMLNSVGLQNPDVDAFIHNELLWL